MKLLILTLGMLSLLLSFAFSQNIYQKHFGMTAGDEFVRQVKPTSDNGFVAIGFTSSTSNGKKDMFLTKFDPKGNILWSKVYGGDGDDDGFSVEQTSDG